MAKFEKRGKGRIEEVVQKIDRAVLNNSATSTLEEHSAIQVNGVKVFVRVYERYAYFGKNRSSLSITICGHDDDVFVSAIATGGSQAILFKINTWSEKSFLDTVRDAIDEALQ